MTLTFLNGGSPNYAGLQFSDPTTLLAQIQTTLNAAGWTTISYTAGSDLFVEGTSIAGSFPCYVDFAISGTSPNYTLTLRAWLESGKVNGSPTSTHTLTFTYGNTNYLWLTADQESGCICIYNSNTSCSGIHFGFHQRVDISDPYAWGIGYIRAYGEYYAYVAKSAYNSTVWKQLATDYINYAIPYGSSSSENMPVTTWDALGRFTSVDADNNTQSGNNSAYAASLGRLNYDNSCFIDPYFYIEGRGATNNYSASSYLPNQFQMYCRGLVKYAFCGVASIAPANQIIDSISGYRILSTGGTMWQGMRIL